MDVRLGNGYDVHAFCRRDHVWLCGVKLPHGRGLLGHSDADVGMHALTDTSTARWPRAISGDTSPF
jgi:2-C-methyl-D-erythritol 2,4-cyclodiphosphate synthase